MRAMPNDTVETVVISSGKTEKNHYHPETDKPAHTAPSKSYGRKTTASVLDGHHHKETPRTAVTTGR